MSTPVLTTGWTAELPVVAGTVSTYQIVPGTGGTVLAQWTDDLSLWRNFTNTAVSVPLTGQIPDTAVAVRAIAFDVAGTIDVVLGQNVNRALVALVAEANLAATSPLIDAGVFLQNPTTRLIYGQSDGAGGYKAIAGDNAVAHPAYHCHYFAGSYFADQNIITDLTTQGNNGVNMAAFTPAIAGANAGYVTTGIAANEMFEVPDPNYDHNGDEALLLVWQVKHAEATAVKHFFGNGVSGSAPGIRISANATASVGNDYSVALFNEAGAVGAGVSSIVGANAPALSNKLRTIALYFNGPGQYLSSWLDGVLVRNQVAYTLVGSSASASRMRVGGTQASTTGTHATQTRMLAIFKWAAGTTKPTTAAVTAALAKLAANPGRLLSAADLQ